MNPVTFSAARRRFAHKSEFYLRICKLKPKERRNLHHRTYALIDGNFVKDTGEIDSVQQWCREAGVLAENETVVP
jgi:hypothetical protein